MKTFVALGLGVLVFVALVVGWEGRRAASPLREAESQIYIHGTPVCVLRHGDSIVARVGECGAGAVSRGETSPEEIPGFGGAEPVLPPGHPPVGPDMLPDGAGRRILI